MIESMTTVPLHRVRASLTWIIAAVATCPVTLTRNSKAVAVVVHPSMVIDGAPITSDMRAAVRADLMHALVLLGEGT